VRTADLRAELTNKGLSPCNADEQMEFSAKFNEKLDEMTKVSKGHSWMTLFTTVDRDGSGAVAFEELKMVARKQLGMGPSELSDENLKRLWCSLDNDDSNLLAQAEFGRFMMLAAPARTTAGQANRRAEELRKANQAKAAAAQSEQMAINGMSVVSTTMIRKELELLGIGPADEEEQTALSAKLNARLAHMLPGKDRARSWLTLFKEIDVDGSGLITYDELVSVIRTKLKVPRADLAEVRIKSLWIALDADSGGQITSAEFGRFMQMHSRAEKQAKKKLPEVKAPALAPLKTRAFVLDKRLQPGANLPQGAYLVALLRNRGAWPRVAAPPRGPSYMDSPWLPRNQPSRPKTAPVPTWRARSPRATPAFDLASPGMVRHMETSVTSATRVTGNPRPGSPPAGTEFSSFNSNSFVSQSFPPCWSLDGRWPAPPRPQWSPPKGSKWQASGRPQTSDSARSSPRTSPTDGRRRPESSR